MAALIIGFPLLGAALVLAMLLLAPSWAGRYGPPLAVALPAASFVVSVVAAIRLAGRDGPLTQHLYTWIHAGSFQVGADLALDRLAVLFCLLVTGVGTAITVYSLGYMAMDPRRARFFAFLDLFLAAMLTLVLASNYVLLFLGWEGVGLASYLLIGFWQHRPSAAAAGTKAFVMNRVGDIGLVLAIALCFVHFSSLDIGTVASRVGQASHGTATAIGLLLLLAACGKSAQVPLQGWLLDAMEGPTPVSALIHAATMVTAGVYLLVRSHAVLDASGAARNAVIAVALVTILWGAALSCVKDDIKKALAGSTMSQIGYMMLAAGIGPAGYAFAIFHLLTHGFFKATLFLGAGSVMHGMGDDVDMRHYGALRKALPVTYAAFGVAYLAIIGFPGLSGFWSKDKILEAAFGHSAYVGVVALVAAGITAFYMTRLMLLTFAGPARWERSPLGTEGHPHESPRVMTGPMLLLAGLAALGGLMLVGGGITGWLRPVLGETPEAGGSLPAWAISVLAVAVVLAGVLAAWRLVGWRDVGREPTRALPVPHVEAVVVPIGVVVARAVGVVDRGIDAVVALAPSRAVDLAAGQLRRWQSGAVSSYALSVAGGALVLVVAGVAVGLR
jgi:NADH-quinone oxidoreductase subunit L